MADSSLLTNRTIPARHTFSPLILQHDKLFERNSEAIDTQIKKTFEMLKKNAQLWARQPNEEANKGVKVSPSISTASHISSSESSSVESVSTVQYHQDYHQPPSLSLAVSRRNYHVMPDAPAVYHNTYYAAGNQEPKKDYSNFTQYDQRRKRSISATMPPLSPPSNPIVKKRRGNLPKEVTECLRKWLLNHKKHPYPSEKEKEELARSNNLTVNQISNWFINARRRILQPMFDEENMERAREETEKMNNKRLLDEQKYGRHDVYNYQNDGRSPSPASFDSYYYPSTEVSSACYKNSYGYQQHQQKQQRPFGSQKMGFRRVTESPIYQQNNLYASR